MTNPNRYLMAAASGMGNLPIGSYDDGAEDAAELGAWLLTWAGHPSAEVARENSNPAIIPSSGVAVGYPAESGSARSYANREPERAASDPASSLRLPEGACNDCHGGAYDPRDGER